MNKATLATVLLSLVTSSAYALELSSVEKEETYKTAKNIEAVMNCFDPKTATLIVGNKVQINAGTPIVIRSTEVVEVGTGLGAQRSAIIRFNSGSWSEMAGPYCFLQMSETQTRLSYSSSFNLDSISK